MGHLLQDAFGADGGGFFEPHRRTGPERQERLLTDGAGPHPVITGHLVAMLREVVIVDGGATGGGAAVPRHLDRAAVIKSADHHLIGAVVVTDPHVWPKSVAGSEYWQWSKVTIGVLSGTRRVTPNAAVWGRSGTACRAGRSVSEHLGRPASGDAVHAGVDLGR